MSKDNISLNDILEEFSPDGQKKVEQNNTNNDNQPKEIPVEPPKTLEQLEMERLQAISKGELSDSAINYATLTNKPNKIIKNPKTDSYSNQYYTKGVIKINSRPDRKETNQDRHKNLSNDDNNDNSNNNEHKKIDSRNDKAKLESSNLKNNYVKNHNDISNEDFASMSEKISKAKAKKQQQIDELNSKYNKSSTPIDSINIDNTPVKEKSNKKKSNSKSKKSIWNKIIDYYTIPVEDAEESPNDLNTSPKETPTIENTPIVDDISNTTELNITNNSKKKETFKEFIVDLFTSKEKTPPKKKETFKERMVDFFTIEDDEEIVKNEENPNIEVQSNIKTTNTTQSTTKVLNDIDNLLNSLIDTLPEQELEKKSPTIDDSLKSLTTEEVEIKKNIIKDTSPIIDKPLVKEVTQVADIQKNNIETPIVEKVEVKETIVKNISPTIDKPPLVKEVNQVADIQRDNVETPIVEKVEGKETIVKNISPTIDKPPVKEVNQVANIQKNNVETPIVDKDEVKETIIKDTSPIIDKTLVEKVKPIHTDIVDTTLIAKEKSPIKENKVENSTTDTPIITNVENLEIDTITNIPTSNEEKLEKKPNIFKRIKTFFLMEEILEMQKSDKNNEEETSLNDTIETINQIDIPTTHEEVSTNNKSQDINAKEISTPIESVKTEKTSLIEESTDTETIIKDTNENITTETKHDIENKKSNDDYIIPFSEETSDDAIDIPIEEPPKYKHFWQDPDFNPIDRFKSYVEETTEKHKNRKRSGEIHIEIKSTPDTSILFSNVESGILEEQKIIKSREEFQQQVLNGEYDNYEETLNKTTPQEDEHTFNDTSVNDFNSYEDKSKVKEYISDMKTSLLIRIIVTAILSILSLYITLANDIGLPIFDTLNTETSASGYLMVQSAFGLVAILTSIKAVISGIVKVFTRKADSDSFASIGIVSAFISCVLTFFMANSLVEEKMLNIYMPIALIGLLANLIGKMLIINREENNFKFISREKDKFGMFCMQDDYNAEKITKGLVEDYPVTVYKKKCKFTSDFIKYTYSYDMADKFSKFAVPIISIVSLIVSIIASIVYNKSFNMVIPVGIVSIFSMLISFCSCFSITLYINSMLYNVSNKYAKRDGALLGYQAVEDFYDTNSIILNANDIFPKGSVNISALKLFSNAKVDETLIYAISLAKSVNSILAPTLLDMLDGNFDMLCEVENCSYEDGLGICGWIDNKRVLMGNRELMEMHNIENLPTKSKESELVGSKRDGIYISVSGNLALMLIVDIVPNRKIKQDLQSLEDNRISIAITSCDFLVSVNRINYLFGINPDNVKVIPYELYQETKEYFKEKSKCSSSIVTDGDIGMITKLLVATKSIHKTSIVGNMLHSVACIVGIIIGISFITMGAFRELTPSMILLYNVIYSAVTLLICKWKKF